MSHWLTTEEIQQIIDNASADDVIEAMAIYTEPEKQSLQLTREIFNRSAERMGLTNGATAAQMVPAHAFREWTDKVAGILRADNPLSEAFDLSPISADSGE